MDNGNQTSQEDSGGPEVIVSIVALIISCIALLGTTAQVLQQYYASAAGFANCTPKVMGLWGNYTRRKFRWTQFRFEVRFDAPVLFLAKPTNKRAPVEGRNIYYMNGSDQSYREVGIEPGDRGDNSGPRKGIRELIHTADNERASWLALLSALQGMERDSSAWQQKQYGHEAKSGAGVDPLFTQRTLSIAIQSKTRSWDTMPSNVKKPYLTTTMGHLVELVAVLGMHWREFDQTFNQYRAQGNGYTMTGTMVSDLGLMFTFSKIGETSFEENRIVPVTEVHELCFGYVPTILRGPHLFESGLRFPIDMEKEQKIVHTLTLGSNTEITETLLALGCNTNTRRLFLERDKNLGHLFPVIFELIGMLAPPLHIKRTSFRMLPNPTTFYWESKLFNARALLTSFRLRLDDTGSPVHRTTAVEEICSRITAIENAYPPTGSKDKHYRFLDVVHESIDLVDARLTDEPWRPNLVRLVRLHLQEVLRHLNDAHSPTVSGVASFSGLNSASPVEKEQQFMDVYFDTILPAIVGPVATTMEGDADNGHGPVPPTPSSPMFPKQPLDQAQAAELWCTLVFRMLCWLMLHDFHKKDVQISRSELLGSRLPVYIN